MQFTHWQRRNLFFLAVSAGLALVGLTSGCNRPSASPSDQAANAPGAGTREVKLVRPEKKDVRRLIERPGFNIEAYERTLLYAKIAGYVQKWNFDIGDRVHKNDVLAEIYIPEMEMELKQKEATVGQATTEIQQAKAAKQRAEAEQERAKSQYERLAMVGRSGVLGQEQVDETKLGFKAADAALVKAQADVSVAVARLEVAKADRDHVQTLLQYTKIRAPYDGVVTRRVVNTGDFVQPAGNSKGEALFVVQKVDPVRVFVNVQELEAVWVRDGETALFHPQSLPGQQFKGQVTRNSEAIDPLNRTLRTEIDLPNPVGPDGVRKLQPGMYGKVAIIAEHKNVWALPATAVVTKGEQAFCFRVENGKAVLTPIQIGLRGNEPDKEMVEVLKAQIKPVKAGDEAQWEDFTGKELVIATDSATLKDGQAVRMPADK